MIANMRYKITLKIKRSEILKMDIEEIKKIGILDGLKKAISGKAWTLKLFAEKINLLEGDINSHIKSIENYLKDIKELQMEVEKNENNSK